MNAIHQTNSLLFLAIILAFVSPLSAGSPAIEKAGEFLDQNRIFSGQSNRSEEYEALHRKISSSPDPESKFGYMVFSIARHQEKLLTAAQAEKVDTLIESRQSSPVHWHDYRNIVRVHAVIELWNYASAAEEDTAKLFREEWEKWTDLRIAYMFEEFVDRERFQQAFWEILTPEQRTKLLSGEWDKYLKKSTGHGRLYSAPKQVTRALGKPDFPEAFAEASAKWEERWDPMLSQYLNASKFQRQREFSMDLADEAFAVASWQEYAKEFRNFVTMERDAIRELVQAGYEPGVDLSKRIEKEQQKLRDQMVGKYSENAATFPDLLEVRN